MRSDNKIDKVLWDVCSLVNKVKDGDDKRLDALKWGLIVLVDKFVSNKNRKRRIFNRFLNWLKFLSIEFSQ